MKLFEFGKYILHLLLLLFIFGASISCKKDWLEAKPNKSLVVPKTIKDYQALLDNANSIVNGAVPFNSQQIFLGEIGTDDYYIKDAPWKSLTLPFERNLSIWASGVYEGFQTIDDWNQPYKRVFYTNVVLENIETIVPTSSSELNDWKNVKGTALFLRAYNYYDLAQVFCKPYTESSAATDLGLPLRVVSDINEVSARSTVKQTYDQIISDLKQAEALLPTIEPTTTIYKFRPTKVAVDAMLSRVYLSMENYDSAHVYADKSLTLYSTLLNYGDITNTSSSTPFARYNAEVIWHNTFTVYSIANAGIVDSLLLKSYVGDDLRKPLFFRLVSNEWKLKGGYSQNLATRFSGLANDELYLTRAECKVRKGNTSGGMDDLNYLLTRRWKKNMFVPYTASTPEEALTKILAERRKELCFRGTRWNDLRRLNKDTRFAVSLTRMVNSQLNSLPPNDKKYVLPIPDIVIRLSQIEQNPR
jgi:hypothetical protein